MLTQLLSYITDGLTAAAAAVTIQVAKQQGEYIAELLVAGRYSQLQERLELSPNKGPFR
jgi:hypothetical protein